VTQNALRRAPRRQQQVVTTTGNWGAFPEPRLVDVLLVGGGGGGGSVLGGTFTDPGPGGAGGQVVVVKDYLFVGPVSITIGPGGGPDTQGSATIVTPASSNNLLGVNGDMLFANGGLPGVAQTINGALGSSSGGPSHARNPQNGNTFGFNAVIKNYSQDIFAMNGFPVTSGYPYGAGGGGGSTGSSPGTYHVGAGLYGAGTGGQSLLNGGVSRGGNAAANSGGGGGGAGNTVGGTAAVLGGSGGSGIVVFAWND
jgi:hypothetical protein